MTSTYINNLKITSKNSNHVGGTGPDPDPGGTEGGDRSTGSVSNQELIDLKDQFEQQQVLIAQLKEMLRKTEQKNVTEEKVEEYANTLTRMSARVKKSRMKRGETTDEPKTDTPASEKIMLLRQQLEENKLRLAQRGKFQKGMEETVTQLKAQLDDSQQLINQTPLNLSLAETKSEHYSIESTSEELFNLLVNKDRKLTELISKVLKLEANVIDLQENVKEKDSVIDARTKAITLMTESLSKKGKNTLDALDDTKEQMRKMQENFIALEMEMKTENQGLLNELDNKNAFITTLQDSYYVLQNANTQLQNEVETYKAMLANSTTGDTELLVNRVSELENEVTQKTVDLNNLQGELKQKHEEIQQLQQIHSSIRDDCGRLQNEIDAMKNNSILSTELETFKVRIAELEEINSELTKSSSEALTPRDSPQRSSKKGKRGQKGGPKQKDGVELQKLLDKAKEECEQYRIQVAEYDLMVQELNLTITELKNKKEEAKEEPGDVGKLKKQLDESNKNTIKIKAQHKSKMKELNKKIEELKNLGDSKEKFVEVQNENAKLKEQIDGLEKEKEKLISNSSTDTATTERVKELEAQLFEQSELLDTKNQSLDTLEAQLKSYKMELSSLSERFNKLSHVENDQVASEMTSIHFEEQLDNLQLEKNALAEKNHMLVLEKESLLEKIESILKEKQDITAKLENYMQENMDLIDKLEKLSAEKVSSAESIEIVEGLTQQEKLELEAYQQSLELASGNMNENLQNPELNDSVNQLTEETSDLLQKIELFTEERREVMEKMEALAAENNQLNMKIQEIENNRDILSETYEQLQNEKEVIEQERNALKLLEVELNNEINQIKKENEMLKLEMKHGEGESTFETLIPLENEELISNELQKQIDEYRSLIEIQKSEISELKVELLSHKDLPAANRELHEKITALQEEYEALMSENDQLNKTVKEQSEIVHEKDELEQELLNARKRINDFSSKLEENFNELENYKSIIEENKEELISSSNIILDLQTKVQEKQNEVSYYQSEVSHLNSVIAELNSALSHLENENQKQNDYSNTIEVMSTQLQELKILLNENIGQIEVYQEELQQNSETVTKLNAQLKELNNKLLNTEHELECKDDEILKLVKERDNKELMIASLQSELKEKEDNFQKMCQSLNEKYVSLQYQIEQNAGSLQKLSKVEELETKNKDQLEKMKKIAANLKKKSAAYTELERKHDELTNTFKEEEALRSQLTLTVETQESKIRSLLEQLQEVEEEHKKTRDELSLKTNSLNALTHEIADLRAVYEDLQNSKRQFETQLHALRTESEMLSSNESNRLNMEINEKNEIIKNLNQQLEDVQYHAGTNTNALQAKIQEMEMVIENLEMELTKYKDKVNNLEEIVSTVEERRLSLEKKTVELGEQLLEKSNSYEKISEVEDMLEQRLEALMEHDEHIGNRLHESLAENQNLLERNQRLLDENDELKQHLSAATEKNLESFVNQDQLTQMHSEITKQRETVTELESQIRRMHEDYEKRLKDKTNEIESLETELQSQLQLLEDERKSLLVQREHLQDQLKEYSEKQVQLMEEIEEYKQKLDQQQVDFEEHIGEFEKLNEQNKRNLGIIEEYGINLERLKNENEELQNVTALKNDEALKLQKYHDELEKKLGEHERTILELRERNLKLSEEIQAEKSKIKDETTPEKLQPISTFVWPGSISNDPFDFVTKPEVSEPLVETAREPLLQAPSADKNDDLLNKIKTLEFMLYNTEKEKDDVLLQCQELTSEIARLIYEKQQDSRSDTAGFVPIDYFAKPEDAPYCKNCNAPVGTYDLRSDLDSQIVSSKQTAITQTDLEQLHKLEFEQAKSCVDVSDLGRPVTEEVCESRTAYVCYPDAQPIVEDEIDRPQQTINLEAFNDNDDGWGCGADEAKLEEDYRQEMGSSMLNQNLNLHVEELDEKVRTLELERERHLEEIKQLQIKSGKLIKKLKELKIANDKLNADLKRSDDFGGLDDAIQDELKLQIERLEKRIKETNVELQKEKSEKSNLLQKVQTLQATNNRIAEAKEKQEIDFIVIQRQNHELTTKLEQFEWGNDSPVHTEQAKTSESNVSTNDLEKNIEELNKTVKELSLDNEELQMLLEEQRMLRINAEKSKSAEPIMENMKTELEYLQIVAEKNALNNQLVSTMEEKKKVEEQFNNIATTNEELKSHLNRLAEDKIDLEKTLQNQKDNFASLSLNELESSKHKVMELSERIDLLEKSCLELQTENSRLVDINSSLAPLQESNSRLLEQLEQKEVQLQDTTAALTEYREKVLEMEKLMRQCQEFAEENKRLFEQVQLNNVEVLEKSAQLDQAAVERATYAASLQQLADEWNQRVDQRGLDVAESWKLHLEAQETEFVQVQKQLQKEIQDLEEKCNALDNENNELRKNVDAEIRNEVDKISALQQQISSRQVCINELSQTLQENQLLIHDQQQKLTGFEASVLQLNKHVEEKEAELLQLHGLIGTLKSEIEAHKTYEAELTQKLDAADKLQRQLDELINVNNKLKQELTKKHQECTELSAEMQHKNTTISQLTEKLTDIDSVRQSDLSRVFDLETQIRGLNLELQEKTEKQLEYSEASAEMQHKNTVIAQLTERLTEIDSLRQSDLSRTIDLEAQIQGLVLELQEKDQKQRECTEVSAEMQHKNAQLTERLNEIDSLRQSDLSRVVDLETQIQDLTLELQEKIAAADLSNNQISYYAQQNSDLEQKDVKIKDLNNEIVRLNAVIEERERDFGNVTSTEIFKDNKISELTAEINNLRLLVAEKDKEYNYQLDAITQEFLQRQTELKTSYDKFFLAKDSDLEVLNNQLQEQILNNEAFTSILKERDVELNELKIQLDLKGKECDALNHKLYEEESLHNEENKQVVELGQIIEDQVLKIESLKQELYEKSKDYDSLIAELDLRKPSSEQRQTYKIDKEAESSRMEPEEDYGDLKPITRAELDLALYVLHQRDVRCEELTVELMQLLGERDTLQLKLSNAIREKEELRRKYLPDLMSESTSEEISKSTDVSPVKQTLSTSGIERGESSFESRLEANDSLTNKLSELKSVGYQKDKTLVDEQEQRRLLQMSLMHQHRDIASMLPPEAAARLVREASYTLSRQVQSPSKVLLNWLWGRSTPKVNDI